jgi:hypothetical protein
MLRKWLFVALLAIGAIAGGPSVVSASSGYQLDNASTTTPAPGQSITVVFNGFKPGTEVTITLFSEPVVLGTFVSEPGAFGQGVVEATVTIPANTSPGEHRLVASGVGLDGQPRTVTIFITVSGSGGGLPVTGGSPLFVLAMGAAVVGVGVALLEFRNRRSAPV